MQTYLNLIQHVLDNGVIKTDRTGTGTRSVFGHQSRYNLQDGFPLLTTKKIHTRSLVGELGWFLRGETNNNWLQDRKISIWNEWAKENGDLGPIYGHQWRSWTGADGQVVDQLKNVVEEIKTNPDSRRLIVSAWNVGDLDKMALPPCHAFFQFYVVDGTLSCQLYQRSADIFLGVPFNIASYALLVHLIAEVTSLKVGEFIHTLGDAHLYENHLQQAKLQLTRDVREKPQLVLNRKFETFEDLISLDIDDVSFSNYNPHPVIKAPIAV